MSLPFAPTGPTFPSIKRGGTTKSKPILNQFNEKHNSFYAGLARVAEGVPFARGCGSSPPRGFESHTLLFFQKNHSDDYANLARTFPIGAFALWTYARLLF